MREYFCRACLCLYRERSEMREHGYPPCPGCGTEPTPVDTFAHAMVEDTMAKLVGPHVASRFYWTPEDHRAVDYRWPLRHAASPKRPDRRRAQEALVARQDDPYTRAYYHHTMAERALMAQVSLEDGLDWPAPEYPTFEEWLHGDR